jgi:hypothetical protein
MAASDLKIESYSDRELLHIIGDLGGDKDWVPIEQIAVRVGLVRADGMSDEQHQLHARRCVSVRLSWIRRLSNTVMRNSERPTKPEWKLTDFGVKVVTVAIAPGFSKQLEGMDAIAAVVALDALSRRYQSANREQANLMRRQWIYGSHSKRNR